MNKTDNIYYKKISAFLHDPVDKPYILMQGEGHEERARYLGDLLNISLEKMEGPDWIASAMERVLLPRKSDIKIKFLDFPEIKHPLSGQNLDCRDLKSFSINKVKEVVKQSASELAVDDPEKQFLNLWRNYLEKIVINSPIELKKYWSVVPADTRIPDHSIFEHLRITSACFNAMADRENNLLMHNLSFLLCTIGPVQSFIATARKLQDLWMGSFILSYLTWIGIRVVAEKYGPDAVIFPDLHKQPFVDNWLKTEKGILPVGFNRDDMFLPTLPNRFLAIVPNDDIKRLGSNVEEVIKKKYKLKALEALHRIKDKSEFKLAQFSIDTEQLDQHLDTFLNIYWVAVPWPREENGKTDWANVCDIYADYFSQDYISQIKKRLEFFFKHGTYKPNIGSVYELLHGFTEKAMAARKNIRNFKQSAEDGQKCSLCGERRAFKESEYLRMYKKGLMAENEYLCGVCLFKRLGKYAFLDLFGNEVDTEFPSIAEVAVSDLKCKILEQHPNDYKQYVEHCRNLFGKEAAHITDLLPAVKANTNYYGNNIGGEFLILDYLTEKNLKQALDIKANDELPAKKKDDLSELQKELKKIHHSFFQPTPYYAVIMLDGDNMGEWLKGDLAPSIDKVFHTQAWEKMSESYKQHLKTVCRNGKRPMSPAIHSAISSALRDYSLVMVKRIVETEHLGKLIYTGGDDVLALCNLRDLFHVMVKLRAAFSGHIDKNMEPDFTDRNAAGFVDMGDELLMTMGPDASASMGVVIAHYKTPLSLVLDRVRQTEKKAKQVPGKDAFAISLMKHSGDIREGASKWKYDDNTEPMGTIALLDKLADNIRHDIISNKFIYSLRSEFMPFLNELGIAEINSEIIKQEISRLVIRSGKKKEETFKNELKKLADSLYHLFNNLDLMFESFLALLEISNFLAREVKKNDHN